MSYPPEQVSSQDYKPELDTGVQQERLDQGDFSRPENYEASSTTVEGLRDLEFGVAANEVVEFKQEIATKWELKDLSNPIEFKKVLDLLLVFYKDKAKNSNRWTRNNPFDKESYTSDAKTLLKRVFDQSGSRIKMLNNYKSQLEKGRVKSVTQEYINEVTKMVADAKDFEEAIARAGTGTGQADSIRNADHSQRGVEENIRFLERHRKYLKNMNNALLEDAIMKLDVRDKSDLIDYLIAVEEGDILHPARQKYFQNHREDILYLCCLNANLNNRVLGAYNISGITRKDIGKNWTKLPVAVQANFTGNQQTYPYTNLNRYQSVSPQELGGARGLIRKGMDAITPKMDARQKEMRSQGAELAIAGVAIWQLGKWLFGKKEKGSFWKRAATLAGIGVGAEFLGQAFLGKGVAGVTKGLISGGKDREEIKDRFGGNKSEFVQNGIERPNDGLYLFGGMRVEEIQEVLAMQPKSAIYSTLEQRYHREQPENQYALSLLQKMDKNDPSKELNQYLLTLLPAGKLSQEHTKMRIEELAEIRAGNMKGIAFYLKNHPELDLVEAKKQELLERIKTDKDFFEKDIDSLIDEGYFILKEEYQTVFDAELKKLNLPNKEYLLLAAELKALENDPGLSKLKFEVLSGGQVKLSSNTYEQILNFQEKTLPGFENAAADGVRFKDSAELLRVGALLTKMNADLRKLSANRPDDASGLWKNFTNWMKGAPTQSSEDRPFYINTVGSIVFNGIDDETLIDDFFPVPFFTEMNTKYPTINAHKKFFVRYLNTHQKNRLNAQQ